MAAAISAEDFMKLGDEMHLSGDDKVRFVALMIAMLKDQELRGRKGSRIDFIKLTV